MRGSILSQDEIDALLHAGQSESVREGLFDILTRAANDVMAWFGKSFPAALEMEGPYIERLSGNLEQSITDESYVLAVDLGPNELFMFISASDGEALGQQMGTSVPEGLITIGRVWADELASLSGLQYNLFQPQLVGAPFLAGLPLEKGSVFVRHLLRFQGGDQLEFCLFIKGSHASALLENFKARPAATFQRGGRLLRGQKSPVTEATFMPLDSTGRDTRTHGINLLEDIALTVTVELGQTKLTLDQLLDLVPQSVISLTRHAGDPVDVYVNNRLAAKGEVVVLEENFGVRILEILSQSKTRRDDGR